jgi:hypothetical protein
MPDPSLSPSSAMPESRWLQLPARPNAIAALIIGFTLLRLLMAATVPLMPQEAYYWQWSRDLDWSYFDHPPMVAYGIALTTAMFGQTAFAIKLAAVLWALGWNLLWARLVLDMFGSRRLAFWSLLALNLTVVYQAHGAGPTPDTPLIFGWIGVIWAVWRASASGQGRWWLLAGVFAGLAMLSKYSAVLLLPVVLLYLLLSPQQRHWLRSPWPYLAVAIAALMFTPVVWWNAQHDWVSFAFQSSRRVGQMAQFKPRNFLVLVGTQMLMVTPYLLVLAMVAMLRGLRDGFAGRLDDRMRLLLINGALPVIFFSLVSFRSVVKLNWLAPAYWSLIVLAMHHLLRRANGMRPVVWGLASSAALVLLMFVVMAVPNLPLGNTNTWSGWQDAADAAERAAKPLRDQGIKTFVFAPNYKTSSLMRFHLPGQPRTYAQDIFGRRALQYDYFPLADDLKGATGILVRSDHLQNRLDLKQLEAWFDSCEPAEVVKTMGFGRVARRVEIYLCSNYKGHPHLDPTTGSTDNTDEDGE